MIRQKDKDTINVLMNIDSYFGEHQGRMAPMMTFLFASAAPFIFYVFFLTAFIPLKWILIFEVFWTGRMALFFIGHENEKLAQFKQQREDEYANADDLIRQSYIHEDGLIEYYNGTVAYIISAFTTTYFSDNGLSIDLEEFLSKLKQYEYDIYGHLFYDEFRLQDNLEQMSVYTDKEMLKERIAFYILQDKYSEDHTMLYRINIVVRASKYDWKNLRETVTALVHSSYSDVFKECFICNRDQVSDVVSRDICAYVDMEEMLKNKHSNENYYGSKVLFYGDDVPEEYKQTRDEAGLEGRRVTED